MIGLLEEVLFFTRTEQHTDAVYKYRLKWM